jgi:hypothetical protein
VINTCRRLPGFFPKKIDVLQQLVETNSKASLENQNDQNYEFFPSSHIKRRQYFWHDIFVMVPCFPFVPWPHISETTACIYRGNEATRMKKQLGHPS